MMKLERRAALQVLLLAAGRRVQLPAAALVPNSAIADLLVNADGSEGSFSIATSLAIDKRLLSKGVLPVFPLVVERRDIEALLADESAFRSKLVSGAFTNENDQRCTAASCKDRLPQMPATVYSATIAGTPRSEPAPPLTLGSLSTGYFETLAAASSNPDAVMAAAKEYSMAARDANELALFVQRSSSESSSRTTSDQSESSSRTTSDQSASSPQAVEYLDGTVEATRRCAASLAQVAALLPPQPSQVVVDRLYAEENERLAEGT